MNKLPEAADALREAIRLQPDFTGAHTNLASVLQQQGDSEGAAKERKLAAELMKGKVGEQAALFDTNSGIRLMNVGDLDGAISQFEAALKISPNSALAHYQLGRALQRKGETDEGGQHLKRAAEIDPHYR
jgi:tetratricopeptide (TPR) repeat protein